MPVPGWTASPTRSTKKTLRETSANCINGSRMASIGPNHCVELHPQGKRETETDLDSRPRGQTRAEGDGRNTECHLRAGFSRLLLRVPTRTRGTPCIGRSGAGHLHSAHGMDPRARYHLVLRHDCEGATHRDDREANKRRQRASADPEMDPGRSH